MHSSWRVGLKPYSGTSVPCIPMYCKIGGSWNLMKEQYLSKTPFLRFVYLSKCKINLPCIVGNSQIRFLWTGLVCTKFRYKLSAEHSTHIDTKGLFLALGLSRTMFSIILRHNSKQRWANNSVFEYHSNTSGRILVFVFVFGWLFEIKYY